MAKKEKMREEDQYQMEAELLSAVEDHPYLIFALKNKYVTERLWDVALEKDPTIFRYRRTPNYNDCMKAVLLDGENILYVPMQFRDYRICRAAILNKPSIVLQLPKEQLDSRLIQEAIDQDGSLLKYFEDDVDGFYLEDKIGEHPGILLQLSHPDDELVIKAIEANPGLMLTVPSDWLTDDVRKAIAERHPDWASYIPNA